MADVTAKLVDALTNIVAKVNDKDDLREFIRPLARLYHAIEIPLEHYQVASEVSYL